MIRHLLAIASFSVLLSNPLVAAGHPNATHKCASGEVACLYGSMGGTPFCCKGSSCPRAERPPTSCKEVPKPKANEIESTESAQ